MDVLAYVPPRRLDLHLPVVLHRLGSPSTCERNLLIRFPCLMRPDPNSDFPVQPLEKVQQFVGSEAAVMPVHQVRHVRLRNTKYSGNFSLFKLFGRDDFIYTKADLRP